MEVKLVIDTTWFMSPIAISVACFIYVLIGVFVTRKCVAKVMIKEFCSNSLSHRELDCIEKFLVTLFSLVATCVWPLFILCFLLQFVYLSGMKKD